MRPEMTLVIAVGVFVSAGALLVGGLQQRSQRIAALHREIGVAREQENAMRERERQLREATDLRSFRNLLEKPPVGNYLTPLERKRLSGRTGLE